MRWERLSGTESWGCRSGPGAAAAALPWAGRCWHPTTAPCARSGAVLAGNSPSWEWSSSHQSAVLRTGTAAKHNRLLNLCARGLWELLCHEPAVPHSGFVPEGLTGALNLAGNTVAEATGEVTKWWLLPALEITGTSFLWEPNALCSPRTGSPRAPDAHGAGPGCHVTVTEAGAPGILALCRFLAALSDPGLCWSTGRALGAHCESGAEMQVLALGQALWSLHNLCFPSTDNSSSSSCLQVKNGLLNAEADGPKVWVWNYSALLSWQREKSCGIWEWAGGSSGSAADEALSLGHDLRGVLGFLLTPSFPLPAPFLPFSEGWFNRVTQLAPGSTFRLLPRECVWGRRQLRCHTVTPASCPSATHLHRAQLNWLLKYRPDHTLVAVRGGEGPLIAIVPPKVFLRWEERTQWQRINLCWLPWKKPQGKIPCKACGCRFCSHLSSPHTACDTPGTSVLPLVSIFFNSLNRVA